MQNFLDQEWCGWWGGGDTNSIKNYLNMFAQAIDFGVLYRKLYYLPSHTSHKGFDFDVVELDLISVSSAVFNP